MLFLVGLGAQFSCLIFLVFRDQLIGVRVEGKTCSNDSCELGRAGQYLVSSGFLLLCWFHFSWSHSIKNTVSKIDILLIAALNVSY